MKGDEIMTLTVREELKSSFPETTFIGWTKTAFEDVLCRTKHAKIKKDGTFYKNDKNLINNFIITSYNSLIRRFEVDVAMVEDEKATVLRLLDALPAEKFRTFAEIAFEPYINLETDTTIIYGG